MWAVFTTNGRVKGYRTWRGAKNAFSMAGWKQACRRGEEAKDAWAEDQLKFDRVSEWDVRRVGSIHIDGISIRYVGV